MSAKHTQLRERWSQERAAGRDARHRNELGDEWGHLERAHVLSQPLAIPHVRTHVAMLGYGLRRRDGREIVGQLARMFVAAPGTWTRHYPVGNTGGANVSATKTMPIPEDLQVFLDAPTTDDESLESAPPKGHIGRIVAGSLIAGLVAAIALVVGPFAGAQEHVITGSVLLAFAAAWATLAVLSERWTDQPQRWAFVPAVVHGARRREHPCLRPDGQRARLGVATSCRGARGVDDRARSSGSAQPYTGVAAVPGVRGAVSVRCRGRVRDVPRDDRQLPMPGRLIDVGGHKLHINCTGTGSPTVVLEPGLGEPSTAMAWIAPDVAATTRVCVYDRAGRGWSESAGTPQDGVQVATDLHTLLDRAGEQGPYVLAGHSAGGLYVLNFAQLYPDQVAGVALLDSMSPQQYTTIDGWPGFYEMFRRASAVMPSLSRLGRRPGDVQHRLRRPPRRRS